MLNAKEKRNQQAELTAVKSMMATHVSALAAAHARCDAAAAEVRCTLHAWKEHSPSMAIVSHVTMDVTAASVTAP
jgi:hypothetical protein